MADDSSRCHIDKRGNKSWVNASGSWHREDGPARECVNGVKWWCINGKFHREDGPAIIDFNGQQEWWMHDVLHREDGPAVIYPDGKEEWYLNGRELDPLEIFLIQGKQKG